MERKTMLIAGCGYVGTALATRLVADGHRVLTLRRSASSGVPGAEVVQADLVRATGLDSLPNTIDTVFYTAGADGFTPEAYRDAYVVGVRNLLQALATRGAPVQRVLYTSSTGVYAQDNGEWVDEDSPTLSTKFTGRTLLEGEAEVAHGPFPATVVRLGGIYGPNRTRLIDSVRQGSAYTLAGRTQYLNLIHRDDCAGVLRHLAALATPAACYVAVDNAPTERGEVLAWIAAKLGVPTPLARADDEVPNPQRGGNRRVRNARLRATGYTFAYPTFRDGYGEIMRNQEE